MNVVKKIMLIIGFSAVLLSCSEQEAEGPYKMLANPAPTSTPEVLEFFAYFCPHCYELDKKVDVWKKRLPKSVTFRRVPLTLGTAGGRIYSRVFYISESLGVLEQSHSAMFQLFHVQKLPVNSELQLKKFFLSLGITEEAFEKALNDPAIDEKVAAAEKLAKAYRIIRVPGFVINGTYFTDVATAGGEKEMFSEIGRLIRKKK